MAEYVEKQAAVTIPVLPKEYRKYQTMNLDDAYESGWYDALEFVEKLPPADVRPVVRGEWKHLGGDEWFCDQCGHVVSTEGSWEHPLNDRSIYFCPNCGAEMRGGDADGDEKD